MIYLFKVSDLNFIQYDSDKDILRFTPANSIEKASKNIELIKRIFEEDIIVNPDAPTPIYSEVIQTLIDADAQTVADVAKILDLYNPADIPEIIQKLITAKANTRDKIAQNSNVLAYPYEINSAIYDFKYKNWKSYGNPPNRLSENGGYYISETVLQLTNIFPNSKVNIEIELSITPTIDIDSEVLFLYTTLNSSNILYPYYRLHFSATGKKYTVKRRTSNNGTVSTGESNFAENVYTYKQNAILKLIKYDDGTFEVRNETGSLLSYFDTTSSFIPRSVLIGTNNLSTTADSAFDYTFEQLKIKVDGEIVSQWHK